MNLDDIEYTAVQVAYYKICKRKLWLFSKGIQYEHEDENVMIGKFLDEITYKRLKKNRQVLIGRLKVDFITSDNGVVINEVKKSRKMEESHIMQVKYYLWAFRKLGINAKYGIVRYPKLLRRIKVSLSENDELEILQILNDIEKILKMEYPPAVINKPYCKKCAYYQFCYG